MGIDPPDRMNTVCLSKMSPKARAATRDRRMIRIDHQPGRRAQDAHLHLDSFRRVLLTNFRKAATTFSGSWFGTRRMLTLAVAFAGITVFAPAPVNPPAMPCTSNVGRAQTLSRTERSGSPVNACGADLLLQELSSLNGRLPNSASPRAAGALDVVVDAGNLNHAVPHLWPWPATSINPYTAFGAAPP